MMAFITRRSVLTYIALTFAISWGGHLLAIGGPGSLPGTPAQFDRLLPLVILAMLAGPSIAGLLMTGLVAGKVGYRELLDRLLRWRVGARWYAVALLTAPVVMTSVPLALALVEPELLPRLFTTDARASLLGLAIVAGLAAGIFEELGWTGFAIPRLRLQSGVLATGLIMGAVWAAWHLLVNIWSSGTPASELSLALFLHSFIFSVGVLPAYRVLMVWVYEHTGGTLLLAMLMHASLTASNVAFVPAATGGTLVAWSLVIAVALWVVVAVVAVAGGGLLPRPSLRSQAV
jgi:membrane protease YdiL (CAAX protease family)